MTTCNFWENYGDLGLECNELAKSFYYMKLRPAHDAYHARCGYHIAHGNKRTIDEEEYTAMRILIGVMLE